MKRVAGFIGILLAFAFAWSALREVPLSVIGQPSSTGPIQQVMEKPFFEGLAKSTGLPLKVTYKPLEAVGFKDTQQLQMLKEGSFDLVSLRFIQNSEAEPSLQGIDMVGLSTDFAGAREVVRRYSATVDRYLEKTFDAKLLGVWTFGPQVFLCRTPVAGIDDIAGLKVRVASPSIAMLISALGGTPVVIPFDDTRDALAIGLVDCAISSAVSATSAGWLDHTRYYFPLPVHYGLNGYAIALRTWNELSAGERRTLQSAFDTYIEELWTFSEASYRAAANCITGRSCSTGQAHDLVLVEPSARDLTVLRDTAQTRVWPQWAAKCDKLHPGCSAEWRTKVLGPEG